MIAAGFGFRRAVCVESLSDVFERARGQAQVSVLATAHDKAQTAAFVRFAGGLSLPVQPIDAEGLSRQETLTRSDAALATHGTGSVAEAAALAAAGPGARLIGPRIVSEDGMATCALARGPAEGRTP